jgi:hypothetical protein
MAAEAELEVPQQELPSEEFGFNLIEELQATGIG